MCYQPHKSAFTLIELLIVVAIVSILASVGSFHYLEALHRTDLSACQQNLRTLYTGLQAYRLDYNHLPPADGTADIVPKLATTQYGCGPAANGYWSGVSLVLSQKGYVPEDTLYCPALKRRHSHSFAAHSTCSDTTLAGKEVSAWRFLRFAYNAGAADMGEDWNSELILGEHVDQDVWLVRCLHVDIDAFDPERNVPFPFSFSSDDDNRYPGEMELTLLGDIRKRIIR